MIRGAAHEAHRPACLCKTAPMLDELLAASERHADRFDAGHLAAYATRHVALVTCMDSRIDPARIFGFELGEARWSATPGVTDDVLRSLALATRTLGVEAVAVVHHTGVRARGAATRTSSTSSSRARRPRRRSARGASSAMPDPDAALAADVAAVRSSPALPVGLEVAGWRYDVVTGRVAAIVPPG